jgi:hypothetical protein
MYKKSASVSSESDISRLSPKRCIIYCTVVLSYVGHKKNNFGDYSDKISENTGIVGF